MKNIKVSQLPKTLQARIRSELELSPLVTKAAHPQFLAEREAVQSWLEEMGIKNYTIDEDLTVHVDGDVNLASKGLKVLPVQFGKVTGKFNCSGNRLRQLLGSPRIVKDFDCSNNNLFNLLFAPKEAEVLNCSCNRIVSFEGAPLKLKELHCASNRIRSLKGIPEITGGILIADCGIAHNEIRERTGANSLTLVQDSEIPVVSQLQASRSSEEQLAKHLIYVATPAADKLEQAVDNYLTSIIKDVTLEDRLVPVDSFFLGKVEERKIDGNATGTFDVDVTVRKAGYLPPRFVKNVQQDTAYLLQKWADDNVAGQVFFNVVVR